MTAGDRGIQLQGKDDLFLAVLDSEAQRRFLLHTELMRQAPSIEVTPVPEIERDPGHGAKLKLVRSVVPRG